MATLINARAAVKNRFGAKQNILRSWPAYLGNEDGTVVSTGNKVFVRYPTATSAAVEVYNGGVPNVAGLRVMVGYRAETPTRLEALGRADIRLETQITLPTGTLEPHGDQHGWSGGDPVYINWRQITPLGVYPTNPASLLVQILQGIIPRPGTDVNVSAQTVDLTASVPATTGARYTLISYDATGTVVVTDGTINTGGFGALTLADIPATPSGNWRSAAIVLYYGQTAIVETYTENDILDLRFPEEVSAGTASAVLASTAVGYGSASNLLTGDASLLEFLASTHRLNLKGSEPGTDTLAMVATNSDTSGIAAVRAVNDLGKRISIAMYGSAYGTAAYQNVGALGAYDDLLIISSGGVTSGGTNSIKFLTGGYDLATQVRMTINSAGQVLLHALNTGGRLLQTDVSGIVAESTLIKSGAGVLTLSAASAYTLTVPATGSAALLDRSGGQTFTTQQIINFPGGDINLIVGDVTTGPADTQLSIRGTNSANIDFQGGARTWRFQGTVNNWLIQDATKGTTPFTIPKETPSNTLRVGEGGYGLIGVNKVPGSALDVYIQGWGGFEGIKVTGNSGGQGGNLFVGIHEDQSTEVFSVSPTGTTRSAKYDAVTNSVVTTLTLAHNTSGTAANGFGVRQLFTLESSTTADTSAAAIDVLWNDSTHATRNAKGKLIAFDTAEREGFSWGASGTAPTLSFYGGTLVARGAALTVQLTTLTHTAPGTPDYALQDLIDSSAAPAFGFATKDEGNTVMSVIANLQTRVAELEARLNAGTGVNLIA